MTTTVEPQTTTKRPMTGAEYLDSIRDDREIWIYGERVKDVTAHPAFRNTARMIARLYDALHDPARQAVLTTAGMLPAEAKPELVLAVRDGTVTPRSAV